MNIIERALLLLLLAVSSLPAAVLAQSYVLPTGQHGVVGAIETLVITTEETLADVAREHDVGHVEIRLANPTVDFWLPSEGAEILLPKRYVLPYARRRGIVLNVPEMRLYYYPRSCSEDSACEVFTYPVSIGRMDWKTPLGNTHVTSKRANPSWRPPPSIRLEAAEQGNPLPEIVPPGPDNPLGAYALYLGLPSYRIHGTNKPYGVGMRVTHGCVRMYPEDIEFMFSVVPVGTPVQIVSQPVKFGWEAGTLYMEVHPPLDEDESGAMLDDLARTELGAIANKYDLRVDEREFQRALIEQSGMPVAISIRTDEG